MSLLDRVTALLDEIVAEEVIGRFRALVAADIEEKSTPGDPDDLVTVVDRAVERRLERALPLLLPGSVVVGEEAVHTEPARVRALDQSAPVWLVDPIDGTRNFARGDDTFGVMVALHLAGATRAAWIKLPARAETFVAVRQAGSFLNGQRIQVPGTCPQPSGREGLRGTLYTRFMPTDVAARVQRSTEGRFCATPGPGAAAIEYTSLARGEKDFVVYYRLLPWDHAPGALVLTEAGGYVEHVDGRPYSPGSANQLTVVGRSQAVCATVRGWLMKC
jgi:fructose-1,6-bisphosphatase/inositol monophosphatase family enzyme